jgi:hypothetical protein
MQELSNKVIELISVKAINNLLTEDFPSTLSKIHLYGLHPKGYRTFEIDCGKFHPIIRRNGI